MKKVKAISCLCALLMVTSVLGGCKKDADPVHTTDGKSFTYWVTLDQNVSRTQKSFADLMFYQELEKRSGVHIDFIHPIEGSTGNEAFLTMLASKELPDLIEYSWEGYTGGPQQAIDDEVIISLNDYLEEYAPNYYDYMEGEKGKANDYLYKLQSVTQDGQHYGFNNLSIGTTRMFSGVFARKDLMDKWGMDIPQTIDDWEAYLKKAKEEGFSKPFTAQAGTFAICTGRDTFNTAFGVARGFYVKDGRVVFAPFEDGHKEYIAVLSDWVAKGYVDTGFVTNDTETVKGNMLNGTSVATWQYISTLGELEVAGKTVNPEFELVACPTVVNANGDLPEYGAGSAEATSQAIAISKTCGNYIEAIKWCDYLYSDEGSTLRTFGIEGDTYTIEKIDGEDHFVYTDKITTPSNSGAESVNDALYKYLLPANHPGLNQHPDYLAGYYQEQSQKDAMALWNQNRIIDKEKMMPTAIMFTDDELREKTDIMEIVEDALEVALTDILLGKKDMSTYDAAIQQAKDNGMERVIEINQEVYERYMKLVD